SVAATRQNAGSLLYSDAPAGDPVGSGGVNSPAPTVCAEVIVVFGCERDARLSQEAAFAGRLLKANSGSRTPKITTPVRHLLLKSTVHLFSANARYPSYCASFQPRRTPVVSACRRWSC